MCFKFFGGAELPFQAEAAPANFSSAAACKEVILGWSIPKWYESTSYEK